MLWMDLWLVINQLWYSGSEAVLLSMEFILTTVSTKRKLTLGTVLRTQILGRRSQYQGIHHPLNPLGQTWANFCFEIPTDGNTRSERSKTLRQLHWSQWKFLNFAIIENWLWVRPFLPVSPSVRISEPHLARIWPTPFGCWNTPRNYSSSPTFWVLDLVASVYFLLVETVLGARTETWVVTSW